MDAISCPYCNSVLSPAEVPRLDGKARCPRCGEPLPANLTAGATLQPAHYSAAPPKYQPWTNRGIGLSIVGGMVLLALAGLVFALLTVDARRKNDYRVRKNPNPPPSVQAPGELAGLGFLPPEVNCVAAVQVSELLKDPQGKKLLEAPRPAFVNLILGAVEKWSRLKLADVDQIVVGTEIKDKLPQLTVVVRTRNAYDPAALAKALAPLEPTQHRGKTLFRFAAQPGQGMLWCPEPRTFVLLIRLDALKLADLDAIPLVPRTGADAVPSAIKTIVDQRVSKQSLIWAAGEFGQAGAFKDLLAFTPVSPDWVNFLARINGFGASLVSQEGLDFVSHFRAGPQDARFVERELDTIKLPEIKAKVVAPPPMGTAGSNQWVTLQLRGSALAFREALGR